MSLHQINTQFLKSNVEILYQKTFEEPLYPVELYEVAGHLKVKRNSVNCYLSSIYDRQREQNNIFSTLSKETRQVIIFGAAEGESITYIQDNYPNVVRIVVIEPSVALYNHFLSKFPIEKGIGRGNVTFFVNEDLDRLVNALTILTSRIKETQIFASLCYQALFSDLYEQTTQKLVTSLRYLRANTAMGFSISHLWAYNSLKNLKHPADQLERYMPHFEGKPIVLVGAGPSLNEELEWLRDAKDKAIIVALGSGMRVLDKNGIVPHFRMAYDGHELEQAVFDGIDTSAAPLIFSGRLFHKILDSYHGDKIRMVIEQDSISNYLVEAMGIDFTPITTGPSITVVAVDLFARAKAKSIVLLGQDLSYHKNGVAYAQGGRNQDTFIDVEKDEFIEIKNSDGEVLYTTTAFLGARDSLEMVIKNYPEMSFLNCTKGGIDIAGAAKASFSACVQNWSEMTDTSWFFEKVVYDDLDVHLSRYAQAVEVMRKEIAEIEIITERRNKAIKKFMHMRQRGIKDKKLDLQLIEIDRIYEEMERIKLFKVELHPNLLYVFNAIVLQHYYEGKDRAAYYLSKEKTLLGCAAQLEEYLLILKEMLWELDDRDRPADLMKEGKHEV